VATKQAANTSRGTSSSSNTVDNDDDRGLTVAQANFERNFEIERAQSEQQRKSMADYYAHKQKSIGTKLDRDIHKTVSDPVLMDAHSEGYKEKPSVGDHLLWKPTLQDRFELVDILFGKKTKDGPARK